MVYENVKFFCLTNDANRQGKVGGLFGKETWKGDIPCNDSREDTKGTTGNMSTAACVELTSSQKDKGDSQEEEKRDHTNRRTVAGDEEKSGHDSPGSEVDTERLGKNIFVTSVGRLDTGTRDKDQCIREPETTIAREGGGTKGVASAELPHTGQQLHAREKTDQYTTFLCTLIWMTYLDQATIEESETDDDVVGTGRRNTSTGVVEW